MIKRVTVYQTSDGQTFPSENDARIHAQNRYGKLVDILAHCALKHTKYVDMAEFIESAIADFQTLAELRADMQLQEESDDDRA